MILTIVGNTGKLRGCNNCGSFNPIKLLELEALLCKHCFDLFLRQNIKNRSISL